MLNSSGIYEASSAFLLIYWFFGWHFWNPLHRCKVYKVDKIKYFAVYVEHQIKQRQVENLS